MIQKKQPGYLLRERSQDQYKIRVNTGASCVGVVVRTQCHLAILIVPTDFARNGSVTHGVLAKTELPVLVNMSMGHSELVTGILSPNEFCIICIKPDPYGRPGAG